MALISFEVQVIDHQRKLRTWSRHAKCVPAAQSAMAAQRRFGVDASVWTAGDNRKWTVDGFVEAVRRGDYA